MYELVTINVPSSSMHVLIGSLIVMKMQSNLKISLLWMSLYQY